MTTEQNRSFFFLFLVKIQMEPVDGEQSQIELQPINGVEVTLHSRPFGIVMGNANISDDVSILSFISLKIDSLS